MLPMKDWKPFFAGKKITVLGLGLLGRAVNDAKFLAEQGAELIVTDLKSGDALRTSLDILKPFPNIRYRLGAHDLADFRNRDFILKAAGIPMDSPYITEAKRNAIPVKMSASWFAELAQVPVVGVTGTRGKSTTTHMLYDIMKAAGMDVLLGGNVRGVSTLALLPEVRKETIALMELDSWQCRGFGDDGMSPAVSVFTTFFPDHLNYYKKDLGLYLDDKAHIFLHQKSGDTLVAGVQALPAIKKKYGSAIRSTLVIADPAHWPKGWTLAVPGFHNVGNAMCAIEAAHALGIDDGVIKSAIGEFSGIPGRLEFVRDIRGIRIFNDNNSTTPEATIAALRALGEAGARSVVLIMGGDEKNLDMSELVAEIPKFCAAVVLFKERGTDRIRDSVFALEKIGVKVYEEEGLRPTVEKAYAVAEPGNTLLFSPAFSSFGKYFANEFDRGDQFNALVREL